jgi:hypothetical protein
MEYEQMLNSTITDRGYTETILARLTMFRNIYQLLSMLMDPADFK